MKRVLRLFSRSAVVYCAFIMSLVFSSRADAQYGFVSTDPESITMMAGALGLGGQGYWEYYNGADAPVGAYFARVNAGVNTVTGRITLPRSLSPGRYYLFFFGIDYDEGKTMRASVGSATTSVIQLDDRDANGRWTTAAVLDVTAASNALTVTVNRNTSNANAAQKYLFEGLYITTNSLELIDKFSRAIKLVYPTVMDNSAAVKGNLVVDGGFESSVDASWGYQSRRNELPLWDSTQGYEGRASMKIPLDHSFNVTGDNVDLVSRVYHLKPNKKYTVSAWVKTDPGKTVALTLGFQNTYVPPAGYPVQAQILSGITATGSWQRVSATGYALDYPSADYQIHLFVNETPNSYLWVDGVQFEEGDVSAYQPSASAIAGVTISNHPGNIFYENESITGNLAVRNMATAAATVTFRYEIYDFLNQRVREGSQDFNLASQTTQQSSFSLNPGKRGIFRLVTWIDGADRTEKEVVYSIIPPPAVSGPDPTSYLGIHPNYVGSQLAILQKLGIKWARAMSPGSFFRWNAIEPTEGVFTWYDAEIQTANSYGFTTVGTIGTNNYWPAWANNNGLPDLTKWQTFVGQLTAHYRNSVSYWEIWNEPNSVFTPDFYAQMLKGAVDAIEVSNPNARIVAMGGVPLSYMRAVIAALESRYPTWNWKQHVDALATHAYPDGETPESFQAGIIDPYGLPVWNTESGAWDLGFYQGSNSSFLAWGKNLWPYADAVRFYDGMLGTPNSIVQIFLRSIGNGLTKYFYYDSRALASPDYTNPHQTLIEYDGTVRAKGVAYAIAGSLVDHSTGLGNASPEANSFMLVFDAPGGAVAALFTGDKKARQTTVSLTPSQFQVLDMMGNPVSISGSVIPYGRIPVYIKGIGITAAALRSALQSSTVALRSDTTPPSVSISDGPRGPVASTNFRLRWIALDDTSYPNLGELNQEAQSAANVPDPEAILYSYYLDGFSSSWSAWTSRTYVDFQNVPIGAYTFRIKARDAAGNESAAVSRQITVVPSGGSAGPTITSQPSSQTVNAGQPVTFSVLATGNPVPSYQWRRGGIAISGATSSSYTIPATVILDNGAVFDVVVANVLGTVTSDAAILTVNPAAGAPMITSQPVSQTVTAGQSATFTVVATGTPAPTYQWRRNGAPISGATSASYTIPVTVAADNGATFNVLVSNSEGSVISDTVTLTVGALPAITSQPSNQTVFAGQPATFSVTVSSSPSTTYQWKRGSSQIPGATASSYTITSTTAADSGAVFSVMVTNGAGSVTSNAATLTVVSSLTLETSANGSGSAVAAQSVASGTSVTAYAILRDGQGSVVSNAVAAWSLTALTGAVAAGDLVPGPQNKSAVFTARLLGSAKITATVSGMSGSTGTLTIVAGQAASVTVETESDGSGSVVAAQELAAGASITVYAIQRDISNNFIANTPATWFLTGVTGAVVNADLVPSGDARSATLTGHGLGSTKITATAGGLGNSSGTVTVVAGLVGSLSIETAANGTGSSISAQNLTSGSSVTGFAIQRDSAGNFIANVAASWSLSNITGGVRAGDLVPTGDSKSGVFTGHVIGGAKLTAAAGGRTATTATITVLAGPPALLSVETAASGSGAVIAAQNVLTGSSVSAYAIQRDASSNFIASVPAAWSLTSVTGAVAATDLVPATNNLSATFTGHNPGGAKIMAVAGGLAGSSGMLTVPAGDTIPPAVYIIAPLGGSISGSHVTLSAIATDNIQVEFVDFQLDGLSIDNEIRSAPYTTVWSTMTTPDGEHVLTAVARDTSGNKTTSSPVSITVENNDATAPMVQVTAPSEGSSVSGSTVMISASASDNVKVVGVQFSVDGDPFGEELSSPPYSKSWDTTTVSNGLHFVTALARDSAGNEGVSQISVTVLNSVPPTLTYDIPPRGGTTFNTTDSDSDSLAVSHARFQLNAQGAGGLAGVAMVGLRKSGVLVSESSMPAVTPVTSGRIAVDIGGPTTTGVAFANPSPDPAVVRFYFTDPAGINFGSGSFTLSSRQQLYEFLDKQPFGAPTSIKGTFTFNSSIPIGAMSLNGFTNERGDFVAAALPVAAIKTVRGPIILPEFMDGGGWSTKLILTNNSDSPEAGTVEFMGQGSEGQTAGRLPMSANGLTGSTFYYSLPPRASVPLTTQGTTGVQTGSARVTSTANFVNAATVLSLQSGGVTVSSTSVPGGDVGAAFQVFVESAGTAGGVGSVQTGVAVANPSLESVQVAIQITDLDGNVASSAANLNVPAGGQVMRFLNQLFPALAADFRGIVRITSPKAVSVASLRAKYNERSEILITASPVLNEGKGPGGDLIFPHIIQGAGWSTQLIVFGQPGSGKVYLYAQDGATPAAASLSPAH